MHKGRRFSERNLCKFKNSPIYGNKLCKRYKTHIQPQPATNTSQNQPQQPKTKATLNHLKPAKTNQNQLQPHKIITIQEPTPPLTTHKHLKPAKITQNHLQPP